MSWDPNGVIPNPGSKQAQEQGCKCAVLDNHHGAGMPYPDGPAWWITEGCPLHATERKE